MNHVGGVAQQATAPLDIGRHVHAFQRKGRPFRRDRDVTKLPLAGRGQNPIECLVVQAQPRLGRCIVAGPNDRKAIRTDGQECKDVGTIKPLEGIRTYVAVDGGMSDNPRPVLYGSGYEAFLPSRPLEDRNLTVTIVGKHCESGDVLVRDAAVPSDIAVGDILATPVTGAYGHSMGSNYNAVLRPPVVFCADGDARLVVRRESLDDLLSREV